MTPFQRRRNPYVNRMAEDMQIRNLAASTIDSYTWHVGNQDKKRTRIVRRASPDSDVVSLCRNFLLSRGECAEKGS